jgi:hypothetical protein
MRAELITLPIQALAILQQQSVWNISRIIVGKNNTSHEIVNDTLKVFYPKGSYSPSKTPQGGIGFFASPVKIFPEEEVVLEYQVYFNETFNPVYGGKLPGLFIGRKKDFTGASGGRRKQHSASIRMAWRKDLVGEVYIYNNEINDGLQYLEGFVRNGRYGDSIWRGVFKFEKGIWNNVRMRVKLNDESKQNGELEVEVNGVNKRYDTMVWRSKKEVNITAILFETFFGGSTEKYSTPVDTYSYFREVRVSKLPSVIADVE